MHFLQNVHKKNSYEVNHICPPVQFDKTQTQIFVFPKVGSKNTAKARICKVDLKPVQISQTW